MPLSVLQPPTIGNRQSTLPASTFTTTPRDQLLAAPFAAGAPGGAQTTVASVKSSSGGGAPQLNTDRENEIRQQLGQDKNPDAPDLEKVPSAPAYQQSDPFGGIAPVMMILAGLAAGKTRTPATTMLNSFAEFNKARAAGDNERAKAAHEAWKDAAQQVVDTNKDRLTAYRDTLESNKGDKRALEAELTSLLSEDKLYAAMHKDDGSSVYTKVNDYTDSLGKATNKMADQLGKMKKAELTDDQQRMAQDAGIDPNKLSAIKPEYRNDVLLVGTGKMLPSEIGRGKERSQIMGAVADVFGDKYDSGKVAQKRKYLNSFASPAAIKNEQTLNSTIGHLTDLNDLLPKMSNSDIQKLNSMSQSAIQALGKGSIYYQFNENRNLLVEELSKLYKGGSPAQAEIESHKGELFAAQSMEQMKAVLGQMARNLEDAGDAIGDVRERRTGESASDATPYTGNSRERLSKVFDDTGVAGHHNTPQAGDVMDGYKFKGGNPADQSSWEKVQ